MSPLRCNNGGHTRVLRLRLWPGIHRRNLPHLKHTHFRQQSGEHDNSCPISFRRPSRSAFASRGASAAAAADAEAEEARPSYDLGVLKALFHHAQVVIEEKHHAADRGRGRSRADLSRPSVVPGRNGALGREALSPAPVEACASDQSARSSECVTGRVDGEELPALEREGAATVVGGKSELQRELSPSESARLVEEIAYRVSDLEAEVLPSETDDGETTAGGVEIDEQSNPESPAPGAGGGFARLVVIKELQPVPEHAPDTVRHLLELTLDHHQVGHVSSEACAPGRSNEVYELRGTLIAQAGALHVLLTGSSLCENCQHIFQADVNLHRLAEQQGGRI